MTSHFEDSRVPFGHNKMNTGEVVLTDSTVYILHYLVAVQGESARDISVEIKNFQTTYTNVNNIDGWEWKALPT